MTTVGIHQPNYLPWLGYFAKMAHSDKFVFLDDVPLSKPSYTTRVKVANGRGEGWLTVPVKRELGQSINTVQFPNMLWKRKHVARLGQEYAKAPFYAEYMPALADTIDDAPDLSTLNSSLVLLIATWLGIDTDVVYSSELETTGTSTARLVSIVTAVGGDVYLSGAGGVNYQDAGLFKAGGVELSLGRYKPLPYERKSDFLPGLTALDALFYQGPAARRLLTYAVSAFPEPT